MNGEVRVSEGFDHMPPEHAVRKYSAVVGGGYSLVAGPYFGQAARFAGGGRELQGLGAVTNDDGTLSFEVSDDQGFACHVRLNAPGAGGGEPATVALLRAVFDETVNTPAGPLTTHVVLLVQPDGTLDVRLGAPDGAAVASSGAGALPWGEWHHLEFRFHPWADPDADAFVWGTVAARVDGVVVLDASDVVTTELPGSSSYVSWFGFGNLVDDNDVVVDVDDVVVFEWDRFEDPPAWQGPKRIATLFPIGPGRRTQCTLAGAPANWAACDEVPADLDTSTVTLPAGGPWTGDLYAVAPLPAWRPFPDEDAGGAGQDEGASAIAWGLARATAGGSQSYGTVAMELAAVPGAWPPSDRHYWSYGITTGEYRYWYSRFWHPDPRLTPAALAGLQIGWLTLTPATTGASVGTQVCLEFAYLLPRGRTWVAWVGT